MIPVLKILRAIEVRLPKAGALTQIYVGLRHYHNHRLVVLQVLAISVVIQLLVGWACWHFAAALGETGLPLLALYVIVPLGMLVTAVPVAPAGVGTGHAAFLFLFGLLGCRAWGGHLHPFRPGQYPGRHDRGHGLPALPLARARARARSRPGLTFRLTLGWHVPGIGAPPCSSSVPFRKPHSRHSKNPATSFAWRPPAPARA